MSSGRENELIKGFLSQKIDLLKEILTCAQIQAGIHFEDHSGEYENLLESRERCIEGLKHLDTVIEELFAGIPATEKDNREFKDFDQQIQQLLQQILALDERNKTLFMNEMSSIEKRLKKLRQGKKGIASYNNNNNLPQPGGMFTDSRR